MANLRIASEDVEKIFDEVLDSTTIPSWVEFRVLSNNKQKKQICKLVKANEVTELLGEGVNFVMIINEDAFERLPEDLQKIEIENKLTGVKVSESDKLSIESPDMYGGMVNKYGGEQMIILMESIKSIYDQIKQEEDELKATTKKSKKK